MTPEQLLRDEQRATARRLTARGDSAHNIARHLGVSTRTIVRWRTKDRAAATATTEEPTQP
ncbi:MAG: hypothetical protein JWO67_783 [Streptosporangiaceae bacterium]|nr:hypothetical protein [Streptosporangiaceae bacterium]